MPVVIDLHTHSTVSDGSETPRRVVELASGAGLSAVALTDHDRLDGIPAARRGSAELGVELVPGCEISCEHPATLHLLAYFVEPGEGPLQDELVRLQQARDKRNRRMADRLAELGLPVTYPEIEAEAGGTGAGRPHMAAILVKKGVVGSVQEAFDVWLARGRPAYVEKERLAPERAVRLVRASKGAAVVAHPLSLGMEGPALTSALKGLVEVGLAGVEAIYGRYSPEQRAVISEIARELGVVATGGSDFHGTYKPDLEVGVGTGDLAVPDEVLEQLRERAG